MDLTPQLVVQVQDEVHVSLTDGPLPSRPGPPPPLILVPVLVQDGLELCGVGEDHGHDSLGQTQEQARRSNPARERRRPLHDGETLLLLQEEYFLLSAKQRAHVSVE